MAIQLYSKNEEKKKQTKLSTFNKYINKITFYMASTEEMMRSFSVYDNNFQSN